MKALRCCGLILVALFSTDARQLEIGNGRVRVRAEQAGSGYRVVYLAESGGRWKEILGGGSISRRDPSLRIEGRDIHIEYVHAELADRGRMLILVADSGIGRMEKTIRVTESDPFVYVRVTAQFRKKVELQHLLSTYSFLPGGNVDFVFTPQLRPEDDEVIADHTFRAPAFMIQKGRDFAALIPDVHTLDGRARPVRSGADMRVDMPPFPYLSFGLLPWEKKGHVYYSHSDSTRATIEAGTRLEFGYYICVNASAAPAAGFQSVVRFQWEKFGRSNFLRARGPQTEPFASYKRKAWEQFVPLVALDTVYGGTPVTLLRQERLSWSNKLPRSANNDNWFNVWFNSLRTAYGMYLHARETGNGQLEQRALGNLNLALSAPQYDGMTPSIFFLDSTGGHWVADHAWGGIRDGTCYAMFHNSWTSLWLLRWSDLLPDRRDEIIRRTRRFGNFLVRNQLASGVIPSWYDPSTLKPVPELREENAETAGAAFFLAELYRRTKDPVYLKSAERAMEYIATNIVPKNKWFDFETFFSCSRKPLSLFDSKTGQYPQNTLSMHQATEACLSLYELTGNKAYITLGTRILDYLCLYQQMWSPEWLSCELMGGFGVQNTDGEWSDSRQGYFAVTLVRYAEATGSREYFERGVAALRAMFSLFESNDSPRTAENYAHAAADRLAGVTGLHWGTGSSVVSIHLIEPKYGNAFVNVRGQWGVGIDGCRIPSVLVEGDTIWLDLLDNVNVPRTVRLTFDGLDRDSYSLVVNGKRLGLHSAKALKEGIGVAI